ncbi:D-arabinono-1,4-lactone oxidase [Frankia sp. QA3]|uniref:D-arabinono-1,4-lactone oxidase n=1 Tax=Frankia sp. QA3 TaxID=710111 RepID=UPI000269C618|nr:D-arabinono-1,4-lactone oxidase [Frankia sp. QA3]EIV94440.1 FAD-linked oxidoreductase [Frankia sp. QA3]
MGLPLGEPAAWRNWAGNETAQAVRLARPRTAEEASAVVIAAVRDGRRVRAVGAGHAMNAIGRPDDGGVQVALDRCADLVALDGGSGLVTVRGGMTLRRLNRLLAEAGLALTNQGHGEEATIAGAIATGTHGTGARYGGLSTQVRALEVVLADGEVVTCSRGERPELFAAARLGLGALGVVTSVTLQAVPLFALHVRASRLPLAEVLDGYDALVEQADHVRFAWFPHTSTVLVRRDDRHPVDDGLDPPAQQRNRLDGGPVAGGVFGALMVAARRLPAADRPAAQFAAHVGGRVGGVGAALTGGRPSRDLSYRVFAAGHPAIRYKEVEYAVPRAELAAAMGELAAAVARSRVRTAFPVEVRCAAADEIPLSPAFGRDTAYIAVRTDRRGAHEDHFGLAEQIMLAAGGRPQWGTLHTLAAAQLRERYPRFDEFLAVRGAVDPAGVFANAHLDRVLGPPSPASDRLAPAG